MNQAVGPDNRHLQVVDVPLETSGCAPESTALQAIPQTQAETASCFELSTADGTRHFMRLWQAERPGPLAIHLHGIEGHSRWFESTALALRQAGISTCAIDRRGAGKSGGTAGDVSSYRRLVDDVEELLPQLLTLKQIQPTALFLIGNCWGAKVAVVAATNGRLPSLSGFIVTSPAWVTQVDASLFTKLKIGLNYLFGGRGCFDIPLTPQHFTDNPPYLSYVSADQLRLKQATARFFVESLKLTRACRRDLPKLTMPVLILQSGRDAIVDLKGIDQWFSFVGSGDKTLKIFTSAAHSLDFEADQAQYQECLSSWIQSRASARGTAVAS